MTQKLQFRAAVANDIEQIAQLQDANLFANIAADERSGGFVTTPFSAEQLQNRMDDSAAFVAQNEKEIIAYALAGSWGFYAQWPIFPTMIARLEGKTWNGFVLESRRTFLYGPVCIARQWRGQQVLPRLFTVLRESFISRFAVGLAIINAQNARSLAAHRKLGMEIVNEFALGEELYLSLAFSTNDGSANNAKAEIEYSNP